MRANQTQINDMGTNMPSQVFRPCKLWQCRVSASSHCSCFGRATTRRMDEKLEWEKIEQMSLKASSFGSMNHINSYAMTEKILTFMWSTAHGAIILREAILQWVNWYTQKKWTINNCDSEKQKGQHATGHVFLTPEWLGLVWLSVTRLGHVWPLEADLRWHLLKWC